MSLVAQEPILYARSIRENIRYGLTDTNCSDERIKEVSKLTHCDDFISSLHNGYHTLTGEKGLQLSGTVSFTCVYIQTLALYIKGQLLSG